MNIWESSTSVLLFLAFFVPGFISAKVYDLRVGTDDRDWAKSIFEVVGYSVLNYLLAYPLIQLSLSRGWWSGWWAWVCLLFVLVVFPFAVTNLFYWLVSLEAVRRFFMANEKKPWDYIFGKAEPYWIILHMRDGRRVGGLYGAGSFTSSYPAEEQIYISELYHVDEQGIFGEPIARSAGVLVNGSDVQAMEFFAYAEPADAADEEDDRSDTDG